MKAGWKTTEFWAFIVLALKDAFLPDLPLNEETTYGLIAYILARAGVKMKNGG